MYYRLIVTNIDASIVNLRYYTPDPDSFEMGTKDAGK